MGGGFYRGIVIYIIVLGLFGNLLNCKNFRFYYRFYWFKVIKIIKLDYIEISLVFGVREVFCVFVILVFK